MRLFCGGTYGGVPPAPVEPSDVPVRSIPPLDTTCPMCGGQGEPSTFTTVFLCVTDGCRVWTYEATPRAEGHAAKPRSSER